jgi:diketogulonate reductase-like aldo/keto reductase
MQMNTIPHTLLNNGIRMPLLGLGVYDMYEAEAERAVETALEIGYRLIDTAAMYRNEKEIGNAIRNSGIAREEIFVTTKLNNSDHGYDEALRSFDESLQKLGMDQVDLYLIHWPIKGKRKESWKALERLYAEKRARAIGVANYNIRLLEELAGYADIVPAVDQVEFSPWLFQQELMSYAVSGGIQLQSYSPITRGIKFNDPKLQSLCAKYERTPAQIVLNWHVSHGLSTIPKSSNRERLTENFRSVDFTMDPADIGILNGLDEQFRICPDPAEYL